MSRDSEEYWIQMIEDRSPEWSEADCLHLSVFAPRYASEEFVRELVSR